MIAKGQNNVSFDDFKLLTKMIKKTHVKRAVFNIEIECLKLGTGVQK